MGWKRKLGDIDFVSFVNEYDVALLSETWISDSETLNLHIEGYSCDLIYESRGTWKWRFSGGISVYYKNCYKDKIQTVEKTTVWLKIQNDVF